MDKKLLEELKLYIENNKTEVLFIKESVMSHEDIIPMKSFVKIDKTHHFEILSEDKNKEDKHREDKEILESFRKKPSKNAKYNLRDYINNEKSQETFCTKLLKYIDDSGFSDSEIYKKAGVDRRHFSKIRCDKYYQPKKTTAIALCIALELDMDQTRDLLQLAGYSLTNSDTGDLVIKFCIERKMYDLIEVNEALDYFGQKMLGITG